MSFNKVGDPNSNKLQLMEFADECEKYSKPERGHPQGDAPTIGECACEAIREGSTPSRVSRKEAKGMHSSTRNVIHQQSLMETT
jgi:hypothetical protein